MASPLFTARHYRHIAEHISAVFTGNEKGRIIEIFIDIFQVDNRKFDPERFRVACKTEENSK